MMPGWNFLLFIAIDNLILTAAAHTAAEVKLKVYHDDLERMLEQIQPPDEYSPQHDAFVAIQSRFNQATNLVGNSAKGVRGSNSLAFLMEQVKLGHLDKLRDIRNGMEKLGVTVSNLHKALTKGNSLIIKHTSGKAADGVGNTINDYLIYFTKMQLGLAMILMPICSSESDLAAEYASLSEVPTTPSAAIMMFERHRLAAEEKLTTYNTDLSRMLRQIRFPEEENVDYNSFGILLRDAIITMEGAAESSTDGLLVLLKHLKLGNLEECAKTNAGFHQLIEAVANLESHVFTGGFNINIWYEPGSKAEKVESTAFDYVDPLQQMQKGSKSSQSELEIACHYAH